MAHNMFISFLVMLLLCAPFLSVAASSGNEFNELASLLGRKLLQCACPLTFCFCGSNSGP
ncbi:hypothetical protein HN51_021966 [Arachis hypogaea]